MTSHDFWRNNGNNDKQYGCFNMTRAEDGNLLSHLEWLYIAIILYINYKYTLSET